jgi:hypothetical protein
MKLFVLIAHCFIYYQVIPFKYESYFSLPFFLFNDEISNKQFDETKKKKKRKKNNQNISINIDQIHLFFKENYDLKNPLWE